jgi:hypothetical protein
MEHTYPSVRWSTGSENGISFYIVEPGPANGRQHRRMIGVGHGNPLVGRPIAYSDTYLRESERTYLYARHSAEPSEFFRVLDYFLLQQQDEFPELRGRRFHLLLNNGGAPSEVTSQLPFSTAVSLEGLQFVRVYLPFGDVAIEFGESTTTGDELELIRSAHALTCKLESPLIGCDLTRYHVLASLVAKLHWARGVVPQSILEGLIEQLSFNPVAA